MIEMSLTRNWSCFLLEFLLLFAQSKSLPVSDRLRQFPAESLRQEEGEEAASQSQTSIDDERQRGPEVTQHVDVGTEDPT